jgi:hypothetical protein
MELLGGCFVSVLTVMSESPLPTWLARLTYATPASLACFTRILFYGGVVCFLHLFIIFILNKEMVYLYIFLPYRLRVKFVDLNPTNIIIGLLNL